MPSDSYLQYQQLVKRKAYREAADLAEREILAQPGNEFWYTQQARALLYCRDPKGALECAKQALALAPANVYAVLVYADAEKELGDFQNAIMDYSRVLANNKVGERAQEGTLFCLEKTKQWEELLVQASQLPLKPEQAHRWKTVALTALKRDEEAMESCREWLKLKPGDRRALWKLTELEIARDGLEQVRRRMGRMAKIPDQPQIYGEIYASLCRKAGLDDIAVSQYTKIAGKATDSIEIVRKETFTRAKSGHETEAVPVMEEILRTNPTDYFMHKAYIAASRRIGALPHADEFYTALLEQHPSVGGIYGYHKKVLAYMKAEK